MNHKTKQVFTLIELLVASSLFVLLNLLLFSITRSSIKTWEYTEDQRKINEEADKIFDYLRDDLHALMSHDDNDIRLILDYDKTGRQRLRFVRKLPDERQHIVLKEAGILAEADKKARYYYFTHPEKSRKAAGGMAEVLYQVFPGKHQDILWRGLKTPIAGPESFFQDKNIQQSQMQTKCHKLSSRLLFFRIICWSQHMALDKAISIWDSTCTQIPDFFLHQKDKAVYPLKMRIKIILAGEHTPTAILANEIDTVQTSIPLEKTRYFYASSPQEKLTVKIGEEWIAYENYQDGKLTGVLRGYMGTHAQNHEAGTEVKGGRLFSATISLPASPIVFPPKKSK